MAVTIRGAFCNENENNYIMFSLNKSNEKPPLGIYTNFNATLINKGLAETALKRVTRYVLQNESSRLVPGERVKNCLRNRIDANKGVEVRYNESRQQAHYSNIQRCGSVWTCPVCSAQISEGRRQELKQAIDNHTSNGGAVYLLTLTNPHYVSDNLQLQLDSQKKALKYFMGDRKPRELMNSLGKVGHIRAMEVTYGSNGWHPHYHILLFFKSPINHNALRDFLGSYWQKCCVKSGLKEPSLEHGCDVRDGTYAQEYVSKWGLEDEMTKGHIKKGREGSLTPWDLLRRSADGCEQSGRLFQVFVKAFKGKSQLRWSKGLKDLLLIEEVTDEELATETDKDSIEVETLAMELWKLIKLYKKRADYLHAVELDIKDGGNRRDDLLLQLAELYTKDYVAELMANQDMEKLRYDVEILTKA